jgi:hypothetical protein
VKPRGEVARQTNMRNLFLLIVIASSAFAQPSPPMRVRPIGQQHVNNAEMAIKQAVEAVGNMRKAMDRDLDVLTHLRAADVALTDPMQPSNAIQKAFEEVDKAKLLQPEFDVYQGVIKVERELENARLSPMGADFGRLRALLAEHALRPAARVVTRNALRMQDEMLAWMKVQELISVHVRTMTEIAGDSLRAVEK